MSSDMENVNFNKCAVILLDVAGTTTSIPFVQDTLFPFAVKQAPAYLKENWSNEEVTKAVKLLQDGEVELTIEQAVELLEKLTKEKSENAGLKTLQGLIYKKGYTSGDLKAHVFSDVKGALENWSKERKVAIYSTGSVESQKLLFQNTTEGDLSPHISSYFDQAVGLKTESTSYAKIATELSVKPEEVLFISDNTEELKAASQAGLLKYLVKREGNADVAEDVAKEYNVITSFADITLDASNKRKLEEDSSAEAPPLKILKQDGEEVNGKKEKDTLVEKIEPMEVDEMESEKVVKVDAKKIEKIVEIDEKKNDKVMEADKNINEKVVELDEKKNDKVVEVDKKVVEVDQKESEKVTEAVVEEKPEIMETDSSKITTTEEIKTDESIFEKSEPILESTELISKSTEPTPESTDKPISENTEPISESTELIPKSAEPIPESADTKIKSEATIEIDLVEFKTKEVVENKVQVPEVVVEETVPVTETIAKPSEEEAVKVVEELPVNNKTETNATTNGEKEVAESQIPDKKEKEVSESQTSDKTVEIATEATEDIKVSTEVAQEAVENETSEKTESKEVVEITENGQGKHKNGCDKDESTIVKEINDVLPNESKNGEAKNGEVKNGKCEIEEVKGDEKSVEVDSTDTEIKVKTLEPTVGSPAVSVEV